MSAAPRFRGGSGGPPNDIVAATTRTQRHECHNDVVTDTPRPGPAPGGRQGRICEANVVCWGTNLLGWLLAR